jgi:hypothetical protein
MARPGSPPNSLESRPWCVSRPGSPVGTPHEVNRCSTTGSSEPAGPVASTPESRGTARRTGAAPVGRRRRHPGPDPCPGQPGVGVGGVGVHDPFGNVAVQVVDSQSVCRPAAHRVIGSPTVGLVPGEGAQVVRKAGRVVRRSSCPAGVFPFRLGGQAEEPPGLQGEPAGVVERRPSGHADGRTSLLSHAVGGILVGWARPGHRVCVVGHVRRGPDVVVQAPVPEQGELVLGDLVDAHPERRDPRGTQRALVVVPTCLRPGAAQPDRSAGNERQGEGDVGPGNGHGADLARCRLLRRGGPRSDEEDQAKPGGRAHEAHGQSRVHLSVQGERSVAGPSPEGTPRVGLDAPPP